MVTGAEPTPDSPPLAGNVGALPWPVGASPFKDAPAPSGGAEWVRRMAVAELAEGLAHDLKNQLTVVAASVQLARGMDPARREELLDRAWRSAMRAARLMDEMLRYTQGGGVDPGEATDVAEAVETAVAGAWGYCGARGVPLEMRLDAGLPAVRAGAPALRMLLLYLVRWSADHSPSGCRLVVRARTVHDAVVVRIRRLRSSDAVVALGVRGDVPGRERRGTDWVVVQALAEEVGAALEPGADGGPGVRLPVADGPRPGNRAER